VRAQGIAYDNCESNAAVNCAAAPVYDSGGAMVAAMSISVPTFRWNDEVREAWSKLVRDGAAKLSQRLGYTPARGEPR
jgi:DNA-binding IclR family transcriptional regulator